MESVFHTIMVILLGAFILYKLYKSTDESLKREAKEAEKKEKPFPTLPTEMDNFLWYNSRGEALILNKEDLDIAQSMYDYEVLDSYDLVFQVKKG